MEISALTDSLTALPPFVQLVILTGMAGTFGMNLCPEPCQSDLAFTYTWTAPTEGALPEFYIVEITRDQGQTWTAYSYTETQSVRVGIQDGGAWIRVLAVARGETELLMSDPSIPSEPQPTVN
jgi:hypothetical protein